MDLGVNTKVIDGKDKAFFWNFQIFGDYFELVTQKKTRRSESASLFFRALS